MRVAKLRIEGFRGVRDGEFVLHPRTAIVGPNGCGNSIDSRALDQNSDALKPDGQVKSMKFVDEHDGCFGSP